MTILNRKARKAFQAITADAPLEALPEVASHFVRAINFAPTPEEIQAAEKLLDFCDLEQPMFHGGTAGLEVGAVLKPGLQTGLNPHGDNHWKRHLVYATSVRRNADRYARLVAGNTYRVQLNGKIGIDATDYRALALILESNQIKKAVLEFGPQARELFISTMAVSLTCETATVLEVLL